MKENIKIQEKYIKDVEILVVNSKKDINKIYNESMSTIIGAGGNILTWVSDLNDWLNYFNLGRINRVYVFKGKDVNSIYNLEGDDRFSDGLTFIAWPNDGITDMEKYVIERLNMQIRWFDDIIDNAKPELVDEQIKEGDTIIGLFKYKMGHISKEDFLQLYNNLSRSSRKPIFKFINNSSEFELVLDSKGTAIDIIIK